MKRRELKQLKQIADMKRDADLQDLSQIAGQMAGMQAQVDVIRARADARAASIELDASRLSGADVKWQQSAERQIRELQQRRAGLAAAREAYLAVARKSFGRSEALQSLMDKASAKPRR